MAQAYGLSVCTMGVATWAIRANTIVCIFISFSLTPFPTLASQPSQQNWRAMNQFDDTPLPPWHFSNSGIKKYEAGDYEGAIEDLNRAIEVNRNTYRLYIYRGTSKLLLNDKTGALDDYSKAIAIEPLNDPHAYVNRSHIKMLQGDFRGAIADCTVALLIEPKYALALMKRGIARLKMNNLEGASRDFSQVKSINPMLYQAYFSRGLKLSNEVDWSIVEDFNQESARNPKQAQAFFGKGIAKAKQKDRRGAIEEFSKAIGIDLDFADAYATRGQARYALGDRDGACSDFTKAAFLGSLQEVKYLNSVDGAWCN